MTLSLFFLAKHKKTHFCAKWRYCIWKKGVRESMTLGLISPYAVSLSSWTSLAFCFLMCQVGTINAPHDGNTEIINVCKPFQNPVLEVRYQEYTYWWSWKVQMHKTILLFCYKQVLVGSFINKITFSSTFWVQVWSFLKHSLKGFCISSFAPEFMSELQNPWKQNFSMETMRQNDLLQHPGIRSTVWHVALWVFP